MLGDGHIRAPKIGIRSKGNSLFSFTQSIKHKDYIEHLFNDVYTPLIKNSKLVPNPNPALIQHNGKPIEQYTFATATSTLVYLGSSIYLP